MNSTVTDLANTITTELEKVKKDVVNWGITPLGMDRVLFVCTKVDERTATLLTRHNQLGTDVREELAELLEALHELPKAVRSALDCDWLSTWTTENLGPQPGKPGSVASLS